MRSGKRTGKLAQNRGSLWLAPPFFSASGNLSSAPASTDKISPEHVHIHVTKLQWLFGGVFHFLQKKEGNAAWQHESRKEAASL